MSKLIACVGLSGSGKSTWAEDQLRFHPETWVRVERDILRIMLHNGLWSPVHEGQIIDVQNALCRLFLKRGLTVVCSDTNLTKKNIKRLKHIAAECGAEFAIESFMDVPIETCIARDAQRNKEKQVGRQVIEGQLTTYRSQHSGS